MAAAALTAVPAAGAETLSDELTVTRLANAVRPASVHRAPSARAEVVGRLHELTEEGTLETYLVLESRRGLWGGTWLHIRLPGRPNGATGWVPRDRLGPFRVVRTHLLIDRGALRATFYRRGEAVWTSRIGIGAPDTPTPAGRFWVRSRLKGLGGIYGPLAFGTSAYSVLSEWPGGGVIGIHGTNAPWLIPGRPSHGCIRVPNRKILALGRVMPVGTPVRIL